MELQEIADKLNVSKRTLENRLKKLTEAQRSEIRKLYRIGNTRKYIYNNDAFKVLSGGASISEIIEKIDVKNEFTELEHYQILYKNALKRIDELKAELDNSRNDNKNDRKQFFEAIKHLEDTTSNALQLASQQQALHLKQLDSKNIEVQKKGILKRIFNK